LSMRKKILKWNFSICVVYFFWSNSERNAHLHLANTIVILLQSFHVWALMQCCRLSVLNLSF
jgi:hypothetical protein